MNPSVRDITYRRLLLRAPMHIVIDMLKDFGVNECTGTKEEVVERLCEALFDIEDPHDDTHHVLWDNDLEKAFAALCDIKDNN